MQSLLELDKAIFTLINNRWSNGFFDAMLPLIRNQYTWFPFYLFLMAFAVVNYKKKAWWWILFAVGTAIISNYISSDLIKGNIYRLRPCNDPAMADTVRFLVGYRPRSSSFTSSHATNHFALAAFLYYTLKQHLGNGWHLLFAWAGIICYSQVYVGVHYPLDVIAGGLIGFIFGYLCAKLYNKNYSLV
ncbi:MAG TPA: phosphatase PAP2 family protein [Ferruginibacter sp.]|nr:phosphatase PAP2 family protein [Ferruginibacter sp.]HRE64120.1 phosphatase PAP2 family protein [Ferruginibacter sp.]